MNQRHRPIVRMRLRGPRLPGIPKTIPIRPLAAKMIPKTRHNRDNCREVADRFPAGGGYRIIRRPRLLDGEG